MIIYSKNHKLLKNQSNFVRNDLIRYLCTNKKWAHSGIEPGSPDEETGELTITPRALSNKYLFQKYLSTPSSSKNEN